MSVLHALRPALRAAATLASGRGGRRKLLILTYHRVLPRPDPLLPAEADAATFEWQVALLSRAFKLLSMGEAARCLRDGSLPPRAVAITFDDGYANNVEVALPILRKWSAPATFFIATGFLNGGRMFNDTVIEAVRNAEGEVLDLRDIGLASYALGTSASRRATIAKLLGELKYLPLNERLRQVERLTQKVRRQLPDDLMMSDAQVRELSEQGMEIGGHTVNHPILTGLNAAEAQREIGDGRDRLQAITQREVVSFAYPNGRPGVDYDRHHVAILAELGFSSAVTTAWGSAAPGADPFQLPRLAPWDRTPARFGLRLLRAYFESAAAVV